MEEVEEAKRDKNRPRLFSVPLPFTSKENPSRSQGRRERGHFQQQRDCFRGICFIFYSLRITITEGLFPGIPKCLDLDSSSFVLNIRLY